MADISKLQEQIRVLNTQLLQLRWHISFVKIKLNGTTDLLAKLLTDDTGTVSDELKNLIKADLAIKNIHYKIEPKPDGDLVSWYFSISPSQN